MTKSSRLRTHHPSFLPFLFQFFNSGMMYSFFLLFYHASIGEYNAPFPARHNILVNNESIGIPFNYFDLSISKNQNTNDRNGYDISQFLIETLV